MVVKNVESEQTGRREYTVLVAVDFSQYSAQALQKAKSIMGRKPDRILILHVIDQNFVEKCITDRLGSEGNIKKTLFLQAKKRLTEFISEAHMESYQIEELICEGIPFLEINKKGVEAGVDMVIMGNRGTSGDMQTIFFGSTAERVLRFMKRPVLCVSIEEDLKQG